MLTFMADGSFCSWSLMETTLWHIAMPGAGAIHTIFFNPQAFPLLTMGRTWHFVACFVREA